MKTEEAQTFDELEHAIASLSGAAFVQAYENALKAGRSVLISEEGVLYLVSPDGTRVAIKTIKPPTRGPFNENNGLVKERE